MQKVEDLCADGGIGEFWGSPAAAAALEHARTNSFTPIPWEAAVVSRRAAAAGIQLQQEPPAGTRQTHAGWLRSCSLAGVSKQASAHFNPCLCAVRMLPFVVQTGFFAKGRKGKDKINQSLMENPLRKPSARAGAAV